MTHILQSYLDFIQHLEKDTEGIMIETLTYGKLEKILSGKGDPLFLKDLERRKRNIELETEIKFPSDYDYLFSISSLNIRWYRPEQIPGEGLISGGTFINGVIDAFRYDTPFWKMANSKFSIIPNGDKLYDTPSNYRWLEAPAAFIDAEYSPQYGCFELKRGEFPSKFCFFDSGLLYQLPFESFEDYLLAHVSSSMMKCWQYFYIEPDEIISRNKNIPYITWSLHRTSNLHEDIRGLAYHDYIPFDRLDLIIEYLERCITLLPKAFPFIDFSIYQNHFIELKFKYSNYKNKPL